MVVLKGGGVSHGRVKSPRCGIGGGGGRGVRGGGGVRFGGGGPALALWQILCCFWGKPGDRA